MNKRTAVFTAAMLALICLLLSACSTTPAKTGAERSASPQVLIPKADGTTIFEGDNVSLDASNTGDGYVMLRYGGDAKKAKAVVVAPDSTNYSFPMVKDNNYHAIPLTFGSGEYKVTVYEGIPDETRDDLYAVIFSKEISVTVTDEFKPYLYPSLYIEYDESTKAVKKGKALATGAYSDLEVIGSIYKFVVENISYDDELAKNVTFSYVPNVDRTLESKKGICFDYAALMTCMLRTQKIPTKLVVGYSGEALHAWISAYVKEKGWVENIISFDGNTWTLMDPTLAANNQKNPEAVKKYIGDGSKYTVKHQY